jgi:hypothetical protein
LPGEDDLGRGVDEGDDGAVQRSPRRPQWGSGDFFDHWLQGKSDNGAVSLGSQVLTAQMLAQFQVIVVQDVRAGHQGSEGIGNGIGRTYAGDEVAALQDWVNRGGGLMTLTGYADSSEVTNVNKLLAPFGLSHGSTSILASGSSTVPISHWAAHAIAEGVTEVGVDNGYPVSGGTLLAWEPDPGSWDVGRIAEVGSGHVFAWGDEWITYDSEWQSHPDCQLERFWINAIKWLTIFGNCQVPSGPN